MKAAAFHSGFQGGYVDHIAPMCALLDIPYLFLDLIACRCAKKYYPEVDFKCVEPSQFFPTNVCKEYDAILSSECVNKAQFKKTYPGVRSLYIPHGNSDKGHSCNSLSLFKEPDLVFLYGQRMLDYLEEKDVLDSLQAKIVVGNYRQTYYRKYQEFYKKVMDEVLGPKKKKRILYAPTWDLYNGTFFKAVEKLLDNLPSCYQMIVKLHPYLVELHLGKIERIKGKYELRENILFLEDMPLIYPLLETIDIYVGDMSSIGYDFLAFNRPLYFLSNYGKREFFLHQTGCVVSDDELDSFYQRLEKDEDHLSKIREEVYLYTFGKIQTYNQVKEAIQSGLKSCSFH